MGFVKIVKNKAFFKRYQVKFRRRRECKTDYYARKRLIMQDKNKYRTPKYRFVVRFSNRDIVCQIIAADLDHDNVLAAAYAHELPRYGIKAGLTNYAAAYATGLLLARRVNTKFKLPYTGVEAATGDEYHVDADAGGNKAKPFRANLDIGLVRTTTGARVFGALKGACDGGLNIPHKARRFPGCKRNPENKQYEYDPEKHREYIFGQHVATHMKLLADEEEEFKRQFGRYIEQKIKADDLEGIYKAAHSAIRADPFKKRAADELGYFKKTTKKRNPDAQYPKKQWQRQRKTLSQRHARVRQLLGAMGRRNVGVAK